MNSSNSPSYTAIIPTHPLEIGSRGDRIQTVAEASFAAQFRVLCSRIDVAASNGKQRSIAVHLDAVRQSLGSYLKHRLAICSRADLENRAGASRSNSTSHREGCV